MGPGNRRLRHGGRPPQRSSANDDQVGVNGFGRIGRQVYRAIASTIRTDRRRRRQRRGKPKIMTPPLKYDTNTAFPRRGARHGEGFVADGDDVQILAERDPTRLPGSRLGWRWGRVDGLFREASKARAHLEAGARKVFITAPRKNETSPSSSASTSGAMTRPPPSISNASCTTNGLAPVAKVAVRAIRIEKGILNTVHSYTNSQRLLDLEAGDARDARAPREHRAVRGPERRRRWDRIPE